MDAEDANHNMEILRLFLAQSRSNSNADVFFDQQRQLPPPQQLQQQPVQYYLDSLQNNYNLSSAALTLPAPLPTAAASSLNMCAPSHSTLSLATLPGFSVPSPSPTQRFQARRRDLTEQERFLIFVKILFKCLEKSDDAHLKPRAKAVVTECTRGNRRGDANYMPLQEAVEQRLRRHVGDFYWTRAKLYYDQYMMRRGYGSFSADSMEPAPISAFV